MKKRVLIMVLGVLLVASLAGAVTLKPPEEEKTLLHQEDEMFLQGTAYYISLASTTIKDCGNRMVSFTSFSQTIHPVEYLAGRVYLQKWNGYNWVNIDSKLFYRFNHFFNHGGNTIKVTPGYYRAHSIHYAEHNDTSHTVYSTTNSRYVR